MTGVASPKFNFVVFGASGFTGKYMVAEVARTCMVNPKLTFAVAGRNHQKLRDALREVQLYHVTGYTGLSDIKMIIANVDDEKSLIMMAGQAKVLINCVGPYAYYGEAVIKACIRMKTHHLDISGEQQFLDGMKLKYDEKARQAGVYIVGCCGFDSIPSDIGVMFTDKQFNGDLNSVEGFFRGNSPIGGTVANYGTLASAVNIFKDKSRILAQVKMLYTTPLPPFKHQLSRRRAVFYSEEVKGWGHKFPGCDRSVVRRSQYYNYLTENLRPIQYCVYLTYANLLSCLVTVFSFMMFSVMCLFRPTRWLLLLFPEVFTLGSFSRKGPSRDKIANTSFSLTLVGKGYPSKVVDPNVQHNDTPSDVIVTRITGPDMGYITTPICAVSAAVVIDKERDSLPTEGGVYTPANAFANTTIIDRLDSRGVTFRVIEAQHST